MVIGVKVLARRKNRQALSMQTWHNNWAGLKTLTGRIKRPVNLFGTLKIHQIT
jgi:hypothetical protein